MGERPADLERAWVRRGAPNLLDFTAFSGEPRKQDVMRLDWGGGGRVGGKGPHRAHPQYLGLSQPPVWVLILTRWTSGKAGMGLRAVSAATYAYTHLSLSPGGRGVSFGSHEGFWPLKKRPTACILSYSVSILQELQELSCLSLPHSHKSFPLSLLTPLFMASTQPPLHHCYLPS